MMKHKDEVYEEHEELLTEIKQLKEELELAKGGMRAESVIREEMEKLLVIVDDAKHADGRQSSAYIMLATLIWVIKENRTGENPANISHYAK